MVPTYEAFMRPMLEALSDRAHASYSDLSSTVAQAMGLSPEAAQDRVAWDGMPVVEARLRKAAQDLSVAGLVEREDGRISLTELGRRSLPELPEALDVGQLAERFPSFAAYRREFLVRRGA